MGDDQMRPDTQSERHRIIEAFTNPSIPPDKTWQMLADFHRTNGDMDAARWCSMRASGMTCDQADAACYTPMDPLAQPPAPKHAPKMER